MQLDTKIKRKQNQVEKSLAIIYPKCTKNHARNECPLNNIEVYGICEKNHQTSQRPSIPCSKDMYVKGSEENMEWLSFINQRRQGSPR
jgi:hypothetical protein